MAFNVYHNPHNVQIGSTSLTGVQSIALNHSMAEIHAAGDTDTHETVARYATARTSGSITTADPASAEAAHGLTGTLVFHWTDVKGSTDKTITISNAAFGGFDATVSRDAASSCTVPFIAEAAPAVT